MTFGPRVIASDVTAPLWYLLFSARNNVMLMYHMQKWDKFWSNHGKNLIQLLIQLLQRTVAGLISFSQAVFWVTFGPRVIASDAAALAARYLHCWGICTDETNLCCVVFCTVVWYFALWYCICTDETNSVADAHTDSYSAITRGKGAKVEKDCIKCNLI